MRQTDSHTNGTYLLRSCDSKTKSHTFLGRLVSITFQGNVDVAQGVRTSSVRAKNQRGRCGLCTHASTRWGKHYQATEVLGSGSLSTSGPLVMHGSRMPSAGRERNQCDARDPYEDACRSEEPASPRLELAEEHHANQEGNEAWQGTHDWKCDHE